MIRIRIENVVASTSLGDEFDLRSIALTLPGAEYEPDQFPGLIYRLKEPRTAILLFHSGKVVCTGGKSRKQVEESIRIVSQEIRKAGQKVIAQPKIQVQNIVATSNLECALNLTSVAVALGLDRVEYEPEQFPGLVFRMDEPRVVMLLFGSGKLVCTGALRPSDVEVAVRNVTKELQNAGLLPQRRAPAAKPASPRSERGARLSSKSGTSPGPTPAPDGEDRTVPAGLPA
jgi:transcription initiation factor TFIID TATA-box-binding protein